jgi:hypothetical protein
MCNKQASICCINVPCRSLCFIEIFLKTWFKRERGNSISMIPIKPFPHTHKRSFFFLFSSSNSSRKNNISKLFGEVYEPLTPATCHDTLYSGMSPWNLHLLVIDEVVVQVIHTILLAYQPIVRHWSKIHHTSLVEHV